MAGITEAIWQLRDSLKAKAARPSTSKAAATVSRVEPDGTVWVRLAGGDGETPITKPTTAEVAAGDSVTVEIGRGSSRLVGNSSTPAVGAAQVTTIVNPVAEVAAQAVTDAATAATAATEATESAAVAKAAADSANANLKSVVSGAQTVEKAVSVMQTALEAVVDYDPTTDTTQEWFWHDGNGAHVLGETSGYRNDIDSTGMHIVDVSSEQEVAQFATDGAQISVGGADVFSVEPNAASETGTMTEQVVSEAKSIDVDQYFDLPNLTITPSVGTNITYNLSLTIRRINAETYNSAATVSVAFDGTSTHTASARDARDFVTINVRVDKYGYGHMYFSNYTGSTTVTILPASTRSYTYEAYGPQLSFGLGTVAASSNQTALGRWNVEDTSGDYALVIGNGTSTTRGDALTVDWSGNVACGTVNGVDVTKLGGAIATQYVTVSIGKAYGSHVAVNAPTVSGYSFLCWFTSCTGGWTGTTYFQNPQAASTNLWNGTYGQSGTGTAYAYAMYVRDAT